MYVYVYVCMYSGMGARDDYFCVLRLKEAKHGTSLTLALEIE